MIYVKIKCGCGTGTSEIDKLTKREIYSLFYMFKCKECEQIYQLLEVKNEREKKLDRIHEHMDKNKV